MFNLFKTKHQTLLGVDISSSSVKILEISGESDNYCVEQYATCFLPPLAVDGNIIKDVDAVASSIKQLLTQSQFASKCAAIAVPDSSVISKVVQVSANLNDAEMEELVLIEADKFISYPINEINLDFVPLGPSIKNASMIDVLVVASRTENVSARVEVMERAGLDVKVVDVESYAVERTAQLLAKDLPENSADKTIAVVDVGSMYTHLFMLKGMKMIFCREEAFGGEQLIESMAQQYGMSVDEARKLKIEGPLPDDYEEKVGGAFKESILLQVKRTLQFFYSTSNQGSVDYIFLAGGVSKEAGLRDLLQNNLGITTHSVDPFSKMSVNPRLSAQKLKAEASSLMVACGLALRRVE